MSCEVHVEPIPLDGETNMARDAAMLQAAVDDGRCQLRIYEWASPTISLGYFQKPESVPTEFAELPCVRRLSGGGAILHDYDLTYSCAIPAGHPRAARPTELYDLVHDQIVKVLLEHGCHVKPRGSAAMKLADEPFLCFYRSDPHDLVLGEHKVVGSAQRRRKGAILQHGSLLLRASEHAPDLLGLADLVQLSKCPVVSSELAEEISYVL